MEGTKKSEDDLKNGDNLKNEEALKNETDSAVQQINSLITVILS